MVLAIGTFDFEGQDPASSPNEPTMEEKIACVNQCKDSVTGKITLSCFNDCLDKPRGAQQ